MFNSLKKLTREECNKVYLEVIQAKDGDSLRSLCLNDLFFLLTIGCTLKLIWWQFNLNGMRPSS